MSSTKLQPTRAIKVIPSDYANIPYPNVKISSTDTSSGSNEVLIDSNVDFIALNIQAGDIVYNTSLNLAATVDFVQDANVIYLNGAIFFAPSCQYTIYQASPITGMSNEGCVLFVGGTGHLDIVTIGQDTVQLAGIVAGSFIPVQVLKVKTSTSATEIIAFW